jgi:hypothetical protein
MLHCHLEPTGTQHKWGALMLNRQHGRPRDQLLLQAGAVGARVNVHWVPVKLHMPNHSLGHQQEPVQLWTPMSLGA